MKDDYLVGGGGGGGSCQATARPEWFSCVGVDDCDGVDGVDDELPAFDFFSADLSGLACISGSLGPCARTQPANGVVTTSNSNQSKDINFGDKLRNKVN